MHMGSSPGDPIVAGDVQAAVEATLGSPKLERGLVFGSFTADHHGVASLAKVGEKNMCFATHCSHTEITWLCSEASVVKLCAGPGEGIAYKIERGGVIKTLELDRV